MNQAELIAALIANGTFPANTVAARCSAAVDGDAIIDTNQANPNGSVGNSRSSLPNGGKDFLVDQAGNGNLPTGVGSVIFDIVDNAGLPAVINKVDKGKALATDLDFVVIITELKAFIDAP